MDLLPINNSRVFSRSERVLWVVAWLWPTAHNRAFCDGLGRLGVHPPMTAPCFVDVSILAIVQSKPDMRVERF